MAYLTLKLLTGQTITVQMVDAPASIGSGASRELDFAHALDHIKAVAAEIHAALTSVVVPPKSFSVSFGLQFSAVAGVVLTHAGAQASITVSMSWGEPPTGKTS
jgi:Trypsin-co-occurring domain 1